MYALLFYLGNSRLTHRNSPRLYISLFAIIITYLLTRQEVHMRHPHIVSLGCWYLHNNACDFPSATDKSPCVELPIFCGSPFSRQVMAASALTVLGEPVSRRGRGVSTERGDKALVINYGEGGYKMGKPRVRNFLHPPPLLKSGNFLHLLIPPPLQYG